jgi:hypothetical protein
MGTNALKTCSPVVFLASFFCGFSIGRSKAFQLADDKPFNWPTQKAKEAVDGPLPKTPMGAHCTKPYGCPFMDFCWFNSLLFYSLQHSSQFFSP